MTRSRKHVVALLAATAGLLVAAAPAHAGSWQNTYNFGSGVTRLKGDLYTPTTLASPPAILVAIHMCSGHSSVVHGWFDSYADTNGFYIIAPDSTGNNCFDSSATRSGDRADIVAMVNYLITSKGADKTRVFSSGMSSGGCMTNTLLAIYPDVFVGGSAMPGYPAGAWPAGDIQCMLCGSSPSSAQLSTDWASKATAAFKWTGKYPCSQQWVGGGDEYHFNLWLPAVAKQFQTLGSLGDGMSATGRSGWARMVYKDTDGNIRLETNVGPTSQMHDLETVNPKLYGDVITFLGLDKPTGACGLATSGGSGGGTGMGGGPATGSNGGAKGANGGKSGSSGGSTGSGATTGAGNTAGGSGGTTGTSSSGGTTGSGGNASSGGTTGSGGMLSSSGGTTSSGGKSGSGGSNGSGGSSSSSGGSGSGENGGSGGCSVTGGAQSGVFATLLFLAFGLMLRRRARARR